MRAIDNMSAAEIDTLKIKNMLADHAAGKPVKTIWNSDGSEPCLICPPTHADIQRMAGFPEDSEGYAEGYAEADAQAQSEENEEVKRVGAEAEPYTHAEAIARWEAWGASND